MAQKPMNARKKAETVAELRRRIAEGLCAWLAFEFRCDRGYLFSEHYLAHPLGQLLRSYGASVRAEFAHPTIIRDGLRGRPYALDFVVEKEGNANLAAETKWIGDGGCTPAELVWDAFRLEAFCRSTKATGLLILAGLTNKMKTMVNSPGFKKASGGPLLPRTRFSSKEIHPDAEPFILSRADLPPAVAGFLAENDKLHPGAIAREIYCSAPKYHEFMGARNLSFAAYVWEIRCAPRYRGRGTVIAGQDLPVAADVGLNSLEQSVFDRLRQVNIPMGISELADSVKLDRAVVVSAIKKLEEIRQVERSGLARGTKYSVVPALRNHITPRILD